MYICMCIHSITPSAAGRPLRTSCRRGRPIIIMISIIIMNRSIASMISSIISTTISIIISIIIIKCKI